MKAIDTDIPSPKLRVLTVRAKYPVATMEVGHSFPLTAAEFEADRSVIRQFGYDHNKRFSILRHGAMSGYRVWRVR
jgi:hypothetical protein